MAGHPVVPFDQVVVELEESPELAEMTRARMEKAGRHFLTLARAVDQVMEKAG